ncbi:PREDICTED: amphiregulin [Nipponia nippon]|uniref:amphiregulin n=1 Tax=Nipponia nippon TaxID=128390 RepID=UPI000510DF3B|nr:PREDICTED: amphiregulin [Nipponia nippon]
MSLRLRQSLPTPLIDCHGTAGKGPVRGSRSGRRKSAKCLTNSKHAEPNSSLLPAGPGQGEPEAREAEAASGPDYEEDEEYEEALPVHQYIVDDLIRVEPVVKPKPTKRGGEKNAGKSKRKKNKGKNKKKGTPCEMEYKNFCIHGECIYLEHLQMVTCKCHQDFFGERCGEQFMKTQRKNDVADYSKTVLVVVAVLLSSISFITVLIIVIVQVRKKCPQYEEKEERKKLRQENRNGHVGV